MIEQNRIDPTIAYDVVTLPTLGILYPNKKKSVKVSYLNAADENILASPNLIQSGTLIDELLKRKVLDNEIPIEDFFVEDKNAIMIFLRNTAFGTDYKVSAVDPKTKLPFEETIDLSVIKIKDFTLVEDENGNYPYHMEKGGEQITFNFLTKSQELELNTLEDKWKDSEGVPPIITRRLEMLIKTINGNPDMMNTRNFIQKLPILDSQKFRKYVNDNKPGLDLIQTITTPSKEDIQVSIGFGVEFFRPFYGV